MGRFTSNVHLFNRYVIKGYDRTYPPFLYFLTGVPFFCFTVHLRPAYLTGWLWPRGFSSPSLFGNVGHPASLWCKLVSPPPEPSPPAGTGSAAPHGSTSEKPDRMCSHVRMPQYITIQVFVRPCAGLDSCLLLCLYIYTAFCLYSCMLSLCLTNTPDHK